MKALRRLSPPSSLSSWAHPLTLAVIVFFLYFNSWSNPFILDDVGHIQDNSRIGSWENWQEIFKEPFFQIKEAGLAQYYRPLVILTYKVEYLLFGNNYFGYHFVNTVFHFLNAWLVYLICRKVLPGPSLAFLIAVFFTIHPLQTEEVTYISGLGGLASSTAMLASLYCYFKMREGKKVLFYALSLIFFAAGLFYKESTMILPFLLVWISIALRQGEESPLVGKKVGAAWFYLPGYFFFLAVYFFLRSFSLVRVNFFSDVNQGLWLRFLTFGKGFLIYLRLILFPLGLHFYRSLALESYGWNPLPLLILSSGGIILLVLFLKQDRLSPIIVLGSGWLVIGLLPFYGLNHIFLERGFLYWAEHFLYFPLIGAGMVLGGVIFECFGSLNGRSSLRRIALFCGLMVGLSYSLLTIRQNGFWSDELRFFERMARFEPHLFRTRGLLGVAYLKKGKMEKAIEVDLAAREILLLRSGVESEADLNPLDKYQLKVILWRMATAYKSLNQVTRAQKIGKELLKLFPEDFDGYYVLGQVLMDSGEEKEALSWLKKAYEMYPRHFAIASALILCYQKLGDFDRAKEVWMEAAEEIPAFQEALEELKAK